MELGEEEDKDGEKGIVTSFIQRENEVHDFSRKPKIQLPNGDHRLLLLFATRTSAMKNGENVDKDDDGE